jgi:hypothetical protein
VSAYVPQPAVREADRQLAGAVLALLVALALAVLPARPVGAEGALELAAARALLREGRLEQDAALAGELAGGVDPREAARLVLLDEAGALRLAPPLGRLATALPFVALGELLDPAPAEPPAAARVSLGGVLLALRDALALGLLGLSTFVSARRLGAGRHASFAAALALGPATYLWPQTQLALGDVTAAAALVLALHLVLVVRESYERLSPPRPRLLLGVGLALAASFLVRPDLLPAALVLVGAALVVLQRGRTALREGRAGMRRSPRETFRFTAPLVLTVPLVAVALVLWVDRARVGDPLAGFAAALQPHGGSWPELGALWRLMLSPGDGLVWMAPGLVLLPFGLAAASAAHERLWPVLAALTALAIGVPALVAGELAPDEAFGPPSLVPLLPILWLGVPLALDAGARSSLLRTLAAASLAFGLVVALPGVLVSGGAYRGLALAAARSGELSEPGAEREQGAPDGERLWRRLHQDWSFAAPWARWRILRHRIALRARRANGAPAEPREVFPGEELFHRRPAEGLVVTSAADRGFDHLAWVALRSQRGLPAWPAAVSVLALALAGLGLARSGLDPGRQ